MKIEHELGASAAFEGRQTYDRAIAARLAPAGSGVRR